jgi:hypothetical protein
LAIPLSLRAWSMDVSPSVGCVVAIGCAGPPARGGRHAGPQVDRGPCGRSAVVAHHGRSEADWSPAPDAGRPQPNEAVDLRHNNPRRLRVEPQVRLDSRWDLNRRLRICRLSMRHGNNGHERPARSRLTGQDDDAGAVLEAFLLAAAVLARPQIGIGDDKTWVRSWERQGYALSGTLACRPDRHIRPAPRPLRWP